MTATLAEVIAERRRLAARAAVNAAENLSAAGTRDLGAQATLEQALGDLQAYDGMARDLAPLLAETSPYRRGGASLLADLRSAGEPAARARLEAHQRAQQAAGAGLLEERDLGTGSVFATLPGWAMEDGAPAAIAAAPLLNLLARPLPRGASMDVRLVALTTPPVAAVQSALNAAIQENDPVDGFSTAPVKTHATRVDVALPLLDQGRTALDASLLPAMVEAVNASIGAALLSALASLTGNVSVAYTDALPTAAALWPKVEQAVRAVTTARKVGGRPVVVMHPRRLSWLREQRVTSNLAALELEPPVTPGTTASVMGTLDLLADPGVTTTAGAGTNEDQIIVMPTPDVVDVFLGPPVLQVIEAGASTLSGNLTATVIGRRYVAFASRMAGAVGVVSGTGLVAPA